MAAKRSFLLAITVAALLVLPLAAQAAILTDTLTLGTGNDDLSGCPPPYATVDVSLDTSTHVATFTFTRLDSYLIGGNEAVGVNLNGDFTASASFSANNVFSNPVTLTRETTIPKQVDGFGTFNLVYSAPNFGDNSTGGEFTTITFSAVDTGTIDWTSLADLFAPSGNSNGGFPVVAHIKCPDGSTGFASVPVPPTFYMMGSGLLGLALLRWRRKS